jgi:intracellular septation protein A
MDVLVWRSQHTHILWLIFFCVLKITNIVIVRSFEVIYVSHKVVAIEVKGVVVCVLNH